MTLLNELVIIFFRSYDEAKGPELRRVLASFCQFKQFINQSKEEKKYVICG